MDLLLMLDILIDDAYFEAAELCRLELNFPKKAMRYYEKIIFEFQDVKDSETDHGEVAPSDPMCFKLVNMENQWVKKQQN